MRTEYAWLPPHDHATVTKPGQVVPSPGCLPRAPPPPLPRPAVAASTLACRLVDHLFDRYAGLREPARARAGRLDTRAVDLVTDLVEARLHEVLSLDDLAVAVRLSPYHFHRSFRASTGMAPHAFVTARRMDRARLLLWTSGRTVDEVATAVGFHNRSHFRRVFRRHHGLPPSASARPVPRPSRQDRKNRPEREGERPAGWTHGCVFLRADQW